MAEDRVAGRGIDRRQLLRGALAAAAIPPLCCTTPRLPSGCVAIEKTRALVHLERIPELRRKGAAFALVDDASSLNVIVINRGRDGYVVMNRSCTHGGAQCTYNPRRNTVQCTSLNHAEYDLEGTLLHGRKHGNLKKYVTRVAGTTLEIDLA